MSYELHPLCTLFPRLAEPELQSLADDIRINGLKHPIVLRDNLILDGGNRYAACLKAGVKPIFTTYTGDNIVGYVLSQNLHRRHLTAGQQAAIVASAQDWAKAQGRGGDGSNQHQSKSARLPVSSPRDTVANRAAQSGASERTQRMADKVAKADPELAKKVAHGEVSLPKAVAKVTNRPIKREPPPPEIKDLSRDDMAPSAEEEEFLERKAQEFQDRLSELLEASEPLALATERWKQAELQVANLQARINGLLAEKSELIKAVKYWRRQAERAEQADA